MRDFDINWETNPASSEGWNRFLTNKVADNFVIQKVWGGGELEGQLYWT